MAKARPKIYFNSLLLDAKRNKKRILEVTSNVINSGIFFHGQQTKILESTLLSYLGRGFLTTVVSGHDAISLALSALNLGKNDEVILPVNVFPTAFPIVLSGAKPVPVDVDRNGQLDPKELAKKVNRKTKAIVVVHLYGLVGELKEILEIAKKMRIVLIEDCAQAFGSTYNGKLVGTFGDIACFSFYPTKNLGTLGDGGAIWTRHKKFYDFFQKAKSYGEKKRYYSEFVSFHSRLPEIQAGILNVFFDSIDNEIIQRINIGNLFINALSDNNLNKLVRPFLSTLRSTPVRNLFVVEAEKRDELQTFLKEKHIQTDIHYPHPIHLLPAFSALGYKHGDFPIAERLSKAILSLPFHPFLRKLDIDYIVSSIKNFYNYG